MRGCSTRADARLSLKQNEKDEHNLALRCKVKLENALSSDSPSLKQTLICVYTFIHTRNVGQTRNWHLTDCCPIHRLARPPNEGNVTTTNSNLQINGAWIWVFCRRPVICLSAVYTPVTTCIFQVTQKDANWRLWVSLQQWADRQAFQPSFSSSNLCFILFGMNSPAASGCTVASPTDPSGLALTSLLVALI